MHRDILRFPNKRSYGGRLQATNAANYRQLPESYVKWFKEYFHEQSDENSRLYSVLVEGECVVVPEGGSKYNIENAAMIVQMVNSMREADAFPEANIVILSMYGRQKIVISAMFKALSAKLNLPHTAFSRSHNVDVKQDQPATGTGSKNDDSMAMDSFQSKERTMVILDSTVTGELGFVDNEDRMTMACTRAKELVGSKATMVKSLGNENKEGKQISADDYTIQHRRVNDKDFGLTACGVQDDNGKESKSKEGTQVSPDERRVNGVSGTDTRTFKNFSTYLTDYLSFLSRDKRVYEPMHSYTTLQKNFGVALNFINEENDEGNDEDSDDGGITGDGGWDATGKIAPPVEDSATLL
ncbi:MAG: hypothetical protein Q9195_000816 [Heterodermia aff. obscurata]